MRPDPKPTPRAKKPYAGLNRTGPLAPKSKGKPLRVGVRSELNPPATFRDRVGTTCRWTCVVSGDEGQTRGEFDPAHLIPAQMIRRERLDDWVYATDVAVWLRRDLHFQHDQGHSPTVFFEHVPRRVWAAARLMDQLVNARIVGVAGARARHPFISYLESTYQPRPVEEPPMPEPPTDRGSVLIREHGSRRAALAATHPDRGGDADDFRAVVAAPSPSTAQKG